MPQRISHLYLGKDVICFNDVTTRRLLLFVHDRRNGEMDWFSKAEIYSPLPIYFLCYLICRIKLQMPRDNAILPFFTKDILITRCIWFTFCAHYLIYTWQSFIVFLSLASLQWHQFLYYRRESNKHDGIFSLSKHSPHITIKRNNTNVKNVILIWFPFKLNILLFFMMSIFRFLLHGIV